jgi:LmbE family N-acetylglucosaminyl deacetylase
MTASHDLGGVLSVWAHPDDEAICAAGTLALCAARGERVSVVCATRGELGPIADPALATRDTLAAVRERELIESCAQLGARAPLFLDLPDGNVQWSSQRAALATLIACIREQRPRVLLSFGADGLYGHPDHIALAHMAVAARAAAADPAVSTPGLAPYRVPRHFYAVWTGQQVQDLLEAAGPTAQLWKLAKDSFVCSERDVSARVDVRSVLAQKLAAIRAHRTQLEADHVLRVLTTEAAERTLGSERFRCADGLSGDPLTCR